MFDYEKIIIRAEINELKQNLSYLIASETKERFALRRAVVTGSLLFQLKLADDPNKQSLKQLIQTQEEIMESYDKNRRIWQNVVSQLTVKLAGLCNTGERGLLINKGSVAQAEEEFGRAWLWHGRLNVDCQNAKKDYEEAVKQYQSHIGLAQKAYLWAKA